MGKAAIVEWAKNKNSLFLLKSSPVVNIAFVLRFEVQAPPGMGHIAHNSLLCAENCSRHADHSFRGIYRILWDLRVAQRSACSQLQCTLAAISKEPHILFIFGPPICSKYSCLHHYNTTAATTALFSAASRGGAYVSAPVWYPRDEPI